MTVEVTTLPNGLRVVSETMPQVETASVGVWVDTGSRYESAGDNGVSHMLEHMAFKGTESRSAQAIAEEIEAVGGHINAYTSREQTAYTAKVLKEDVPLALDILADILQRSVFDEEELARERTVVIQEIAQVNDTPDDFVFDRFQEAAYPDQPMGRTILGPAPLIAEMSRETLAGYMADRYHAPRMVLSAAGHIEHRRFVELAAGLFDSLRTEGREAREPARYAGGEWRETEDYEQVHLIVGFDGVAYGDADFYTQQVLSTLLGGGMSSRLFQEVREKRGLAYSVFSFASAYLDGGIFGIYAGTGSQQLGELVPVICEEIVKVGRPAREEELKRAHAQIKAGLLMSLESTSARCEQLARQLLIYGRVVPVPELIAEIEAVDSEAVARLARRLVESGRPTLAATGPINGLESFDAIRARLSG
ncbi:MAG: pitrilysin family protein [Alphaproteobacteria bacterium]